MKLRKCLSVSSLLRIFMINGCWILSDDFFPFICWSDLVIIFLRLLLLWLKVADFQMLHIWNASYLDIVCNSFYGLLGFFPYILLGILLLCSWEVFVFNFFLLISSSILQCSAFLTVQLSHPYMTSGKTKPLTRWTFVGKVMSLLFNMVSRLVITLLPRSKRPLIHGCSHHLQWFWSPEK